MRLLFNAGGVFFAGLCLVLASCEKTDDFQSEPLSDYIPLQVGKYITYRVDSTVFTSFGTVEEIHRYQVKHEIEAEVMDNLGRPSFRIYTYIRDSAGTLPWQANGSYFITPLNDQVEVIENNQRVLRLHLPIRNGYSWKGNRHLADQPYASLYNFSNDDNMADWDFYFDGEKTDETIHGQSFNDVYTILQVDESYNVPIVDPRAYAARTYSIEKYSKSTGLVYRNLVMWEYQPNPGGSSGYKVGFGIEMWMIEKN